MEQEPWIEFKQALEQLRSAIDSPATDLATVRATFTQLQQFQAHLSTLKGDQHGEPEASRIQSLQVEMDKQMRLLGLDINFLQAARQATTAQQRRSQMGDRLNLLTAYTIALSDLFIPSTE